MRGGLAVHPDKHNDGARLGPEISRGKAHDKAYSH
jgi:hypothetical protein